MMRILENRSSFAVSRYSEVATPFPSFLRSRISARLATLALRSSVLSGAMMCLFGEDFDVVSTVGPRATLGYGLLNRVLGRRDNVHVAKEFYLTHDFSDGWRRMLYRFALGNLDALIVNASAEIEMYSRWLGIDSAKITFIPWPANLDPVDEPLVGGAYFLAAGRSLRDWPTFAEAVSVIDRDFVVVCSKSDAGQVSWPKNVTVYADIPKSEYLDLLYRAEGLIVPLVNTSRSTGQATFLEAMALGKPVLVARVTGAIDYITDRVNGLLYAPGSATDLQEKVEELVGNLDLRATIASGGLRSVREQFNKAVYVDTFLAFARTVLSTRQ